MPEVRQQLQWRRQLDLLSRTGVGLPAMAPALCALVRQIVGAQTCVLMWVDSAGMPVGVHHEHPNEATQALFMNEYERLFSGDREINVSWAARQHGQACGRMLHPPQVYFRSNTYNLLMRGDHYRHMLDLRIDVDGVARAVAALCRPPGKAFDEHDAVALNSLLPALQRACLKSTSALEQGGSEDCTGHLLVSADGQRIHMANPAGVALVRSSRLVGQQIELLGTMERAPRFVQELCTRLHATGQEAVQSRLDVPGGTLQCTARWMDTAAPGNAGANALTGVGTDSAAPALCLVLVTLVLQQPRAARVVREISALGLSPLQGRLALYAAAGGRRAACAQQHRISAEALKKHLRQLYAACGVQEWSELQNHLLHAELSGL